MSKIYEMTPLDTLFFRGSTPMEAGMMTTVSLFPPPISVIKGALWTAYCREKNKKFNEDLVEGKIPLKITGFFIKKKSGNGTDKFYVPAPATWYYDKKDKIKTSKDFKDEKLCVATEKKAQFEILGMDTSAGDVVFICPKEDAKPLTGAWINIDFIKNPKNKFGADDVLLEKDIFSREERVGVGLTPDNQAAEGQLYSSTHIRMNADISFLVVVDSEIELNSGKIQLGGEQRIVSCKIYEGNCNLFEENNSAQYLSLVPVEASKSNLTALVASSKLTVTAGWDLARGFHKCSTSWIPAGAVFTQNIDNKCVSLGSMTQKGE